MKEEFYQTREAFAILKDGWWLLPVLPPSTWPKARVKFYKPIV